MPYINQESRNIIAAGGDPMTAGELNYVITGVINDYLVHKTEISYSVLNEVVGVLECAKLELYRRLAAPYEDQKMFENGDVYV